ncbi:MAG: adenylate/guanylate cyclase domain-containing protein [Rhodospirillaceae bacterium]|nr:adenylate/guanylate cyclase domain-containing protein [Rhodospirillaceae bacterium]MBT5239454.1 adenylate/guanylate cyclase domain-containing protein [Rhodospirillaceae bacterium]
MPPRAITDFEEEAPEEKFGGTLQPIQAKYDKVFDDAVAKMGTTTPTTLDEQDGFDMPDSSGPPPPDEENISNQGQGPGQGPGAAPDQGQGPGGNTGSSVSGGPAAETNEVVDDEALADQAMAKVLVHLKVIIAEVTIALQTREKAVDTFTKFGLNLFFAGACSKLSRTFSLSAKEGQSILARLMELTGASKEMAQAFADNTNEYGERTQYRDMIDAGDVAMANHLEDKAGDNQNLNEMLDKWCSPQTAVELPTVRTFMFTDIVDSTALTEELGDRTMQKIIRAHNKIVRDALKKFTGIEVKHTGDGIMATYNSPRSAIEACVQMQQQIDLYNRKKPELSFDIRIGLHTGEAVVEENDYFGATVQTAARICAEAGSAEIWISNEIWRAVPRFADDCKYCGEFALKGLKEEKVLYSVMWEPLPTKGKVDYQDLGAK